MVDWLQSWYKRQCDGKWEHQCGVKIDTLDNPGWSISVDLEGTELDGMKLSYKLEEISNENWIGY